MSAVKLALSFRDAGHEIYFAAHPKGRIYSELKKCGIKTIKARLLRNFDPVSSLILRRAIKRYNIGILHVHMSRDLVHAYLSTALSRKRPRVILQKQVSSKVLKKDLFHRLIYSGVDRIFVLSNFLRANILDTCPVTQEKVRVIPGGINADLYEVNQGGGRNIRAAYSIPEDALVIGAIARIDRAKGLSELVKAFASLPGQYDRVRLVIVGEPTFGEENYDAELRGLVSSSGLGDRVIFTGYRSDIPSVFSAFDLFALPSYEEAFGYVFIEAMAAGLPVIATRSGGVSDIVSDGETGLLVMPKEVESLRGAMIRLLSDRQLRLAYGARGKKKVKEQFSEAKIFKRYEDEYRSLLA